MKDLLKDTQKRSFDPTKRMKGISLDVMCRRVELCIHEPCSNWYSKEVVSTHPCYWIVPNSHYYLIQSVFMYVQTWFIGAIGRDTRGVTREL